jgi:hypothetical protein
VQVYSIIAQASHKFTKDVGKAAFDLLHLAIMGVAVYVISVHSKLAKKYIAAILICVGFTMARTISYTLLCTVIGAKFQQFQPSVLLFGLGLPGK